MNRRQFVQGVTAAGAATALSEGGTAAEQPAQAPALVVDGLDTSIVNEGFLDLLKTGGVDCVHKSLGGPDSFASTYAVLAMQRDRIFPATTVREIRDARRQGRMSMIFGIQHANLIEAMLPKDPWGTYDRLVAGLKGFYDLGARIQGICYNVTNIFGAGCMDHRVPLTRAGRRLVEEIHKLRMILDVGGHTGEQTSLDAIAVSSGVPIVCTHTNAATLNPNPRASSDRVLEGVARSGGVVGVTAISDFQVRNASNHRAHGKVSPQAPLDTLLDQFDYMKRTIGVDHVGLGPDFVWGWGETFDHKAANSITFPPEALSDGPVVLTKGFEDISKLPNVVAGLSRRGWSQPELDKVMGENWLRVYERVWGA
jgi:membrane dipeptidase